MSWRSVLKVRAVDTQEEVSARWHLQQIATYGPSQMVGSWVKRTRVYWREQKTSGASVSEVGEAISLDIAREMDALA